MSDNVLFVEDDADDIFIIERAWTHAGFEKPAKFARNGKEAADYLTGVSTHKSARPQLIFLDLNMPVMNGFDFLSWLRGQPGLQTIPVVVLTSSANPTDMSSAYQKGTSGYVIKPSAIADFTKLLRCAADFWLTFNRPQP